MTLQFTPGSADRLAEVVTSPMVALGDAVGVALIVTDLGGRVLAWSGAAQRLLGWSAEEVLGRSAAEITDWGVSQADAAAVLLASDRPWGKETSVLAADGSRVAVRIASCRWAGADLVVAVAAPLSTAAAEDREFWDRRFRALLERSADLVLICDRDIVIRYAGPSLEQLFGYDPSSVVGSSGWAFVHPEDEPRARAHWAQALADSGEHPTLELRVRHRDGSWRWVEERITNLLDDPVVGGLVVNINDITDRRRAVEELEGRKRFFHSILEVAQEGIWAVDLAGRTTFANAKLAGMLGLPLDRVLGASLWDVVDAKAEQVLRRQYEAREAGVWDSYELPFRRPDGERRWLLISAAPLTDADGSVVGSVGMSVDITDRKRDEEELRRLALYDPLTGLPNRALLRDRLQQLEERHRRRGEPLAVLFCDLDRFKLINDNRGHAGGDALLAAAAQRLREAVGAEDTVARFGGDEFVIVSPDADTQDAHRLAERVCAAFREPFDVGGTAVAVSVSVGAACTDDGPVDELLQSADRALYQAKAGGRGRVEVHTAAMRRSTAGRLALLADLRDALRGEQLRLHYQPIVRLDGRPRGVEALLRWDHPDRGPVPPEEIVALADDNGLTGELGAWGVARACTDIAQLRSATGLDVSVAVNLSARQLCDTAVVDAVRHALHRSGLPATRLVLEVTETAVVGDADVTRPILNRLKAMGARLALDDFGTGYSSLTHLRQFPIDIIKVDRSFVADMTTNADDLAIVASVVNLAATVGVDLIAEGVESPEQAETLRRLGCTFGQGYLWSPAVPLTELPDLLRRDPSRARPPHRDRGRRRTAEAPDPCQARILALHRNGASPASIAAALNADGMKSPHGSRWHRNSVARVIAEHAYPDLKDMLTPDR